MSYGDNGITLDINRDRESGMTEINRLNLNEISHRQIGQHLGIPAKYYDKMKADYPELLTANVNGWFERNPKKTG